MLPNDSSALIGRTIAGKFVVESVIAVGGIGTVYRARQLALDRIVAIKVLHDENAREQKFIERFKREARAASRLDHPNSVRVLDFGQEGDSLLYLAMEYVEGRTLYDVIQKDWPLGDKRVVDIMSQVLAAVGVAHDMEVIHRDLKPENIMIIRGKSDEGEHAELAKVCDFGIATLGTMVRDGEVSRSEGPRVTTRGFIIGTPEYMSPEQVMGEAADRRSDLYAAGVMLYQMLAGRVPFEGQSAYGIAVKHITEPPFPPSAYATVNPALEAICLKAMSKAPQDRYASAREMRAALRATITSNSAVVGLPPGSVRTSGWGQPAATARRSRFPTFVGLALAVVLVAALGIRARLGWRRELTTPATASGGSRTSSPATVPPADPSPPSPPVAPSRLRPILEPVAITAPQERAAERPAERPAELRAESAPTRRTATPSPGPRVTRPATGRAAGARSANRSPLNSEPPETPKPMAALPASDEAQPTAMSAPARPHVAPTPTPPRQGVDVDRSSVSITAVTTTSAVPGSNVRAAVSRVPVLGCYRTALRDRGSSAPGTATLHLNLDSAGYVTVATLRDAQFLPTMKACVERAARGIKIKDVDTGEASADITLTFVSAP